MESQQSTEKRNLFNLLQTDDPDMLPTEEAENMVGKRRKLETNPFEMGNILENIMSFLNVDSIKTARQVSKLWSCEGAKILITRCYIKIPSDIQKGELSNNSKEMDNFKAFLSHKFSDVSMIPNIAVNAFADFDLWKSLGVLGQQVKSLKLSIMDDKAELLQNLLDLLPDLKYLCLQLSNYLGHAIIKVLTSVMSKKERNHNPLIISSLPLIPESAKDLEELDKFSNCSYIMIEEILSFFDDTFYDRIEPYKALVANIISKLLSTSKTILKKIILHDAEIYLPRLQFSCMTALTHMRLVFHQQSPGQFQHCKFSPSFRFSSNTPNLHDFEFFYTVMNFSMSQNFLANLLENTGTAPSVRSVQFTSGLHNFPIHSLFQTFTNMEYFLTNSCSETTLQTIWEHGEKLKKLNLNIYLYPYRNEIYDLDSTFTGFTPDTVNEMKKLPKLDSFLLEELDKLRVNPSVLDLKELEDLKIYIHVQGQDYMPKRLLAVTGEYAFKLMPKDSKILVHVEDYAPGCEGARNAVDEVSKLSNVIIHIEEHSDSSDYSDSDASD